MTGRPELVRAVAAAADSPAGATAATRALGLGPPPEPGAHTEVFVLQTHPYASVHLGPEGMLGGDAADRVAGFWRTIGITPPPDPDHLAALLGLYARLLDESAAAGEARAAAMARAADVLLWEHVASWVPAYLDAVAGLDDDFHRRWAALAADVLAAEAERLPAGLPLPSALADAPGPVDPTSPASLLDGVLAPVRSGMVLTRRDLARAAAAAGLGARHGERRYTLAGMLEQDAPGTVAWLAATAEEWVARHEARARGPLGPIAAWWSRRAAEAAASLCRLAAVGSPPY